MRSSTRPWLGRDEKTRGRQRSNAAWLLVLPHGANRPSLRSAVSARAHSQTDAAAGCVRRKIHDGLPRGISRELVHAREAVRETARCETELLRRERLAIARDLASKRLDSSAGSARLVSVVLPILHGP